MIMILNLSAGDNTSEEVAILLTEFMSEVNDTLTSFKSEINTMLTAFTNDVDSDITALNTNLSTVKSDVATVKSNVSTLSTTVNGLPKGAVKSVQRGTVAGNDSANIEVTINTVNPVKCLVLLSGAELGGEGFNTLPNVYSLTATKLTITRSYIVFPGSTPNSIVSVHWQVIEFY